jgi:hypothetical protein
MADGYNKLFSRKSMVYGYKKQKKYGCSTEKVWTMVIRSRKSMDVGYKKQKKYG